LKNTENVVSSVGGEEISPDLGGLEMRAGSVQRQGGSVQFRQAEGGLIAFGGKRLTGNSTVETTSSFLKTTWGQGEANRGKEVPETEKEADAEGGGRSANCLTAAANGEV